MTSIPKADRYWAIVWKMIDRADVVLEVVDARFPSICRSNRLEQRVLEMDNCDLLIALNKTDLIPKKLLNRWLDWFEQEEGIKAVGVSARERLGTSRIRREILLKSKKKRATVAIVGLPNTGKSSLINVLKGRKSAPTAPIAGHTRGMQKVKVSNSLMMFDTPGILPVQLPEEHKHLLGVIPINNLKDPLGVAVHLFEMLNTLAPGIVAEYYGVANDSYSFLGELAISKNRVVKGGEPDLRTASIMFLKDHQRGNIPIYETPDDPLRYA